MNRTSLALFMVLFSPLALAHPGKHHGGFLAAIAHLLSEPDHLAMALIAVVLGIAGARLVRRRASSRVQHKRR